MLCAASRFFSSSSHKIKSQYRLPLDLLHVFVLIHIRLLSLLTLKVMGVINVIIINQSEKQSCIMLQVAMGDGLSDVMEHSLLSESPALLLAFHVAWIFLSNIVLVFSPLSLIAR